MNDMPLNYVQFSPLRRRQRLGISTMVLGAIGQLYNEIILAPTIGARLSQYSNLSNFDHCRNLFAKKIKVQPLFDLYMVRM